MSDPAWTGRRFSPAQRARSDVKWRTSSRSLRTRTGANKSLIPLLGEGDNRIDSLKLDSNKIWINKTQYFDQVPEGVWSFYIGGYQPAQKWLKDRKGQELNFSQIKHYQSILKILTRTAHIMQNIVLD
ncbi:MAG: type ISP restriction/modification enzyme [Pusillimonas sp.]